MLFAVCCYSTDQYCFDLTGRCQSTIPEGNNPYRIDTTISTRLCPFSAYLPFLVLTGV